MFHLFLHTALIVVVKSRCSSGTCSEIKAKLFRNNNLKMKKRTHLDFSAVSFTDWVWSINFRKCKSSYHETPLSLKSQGTDAFESMLVLVF